MYSVEFLQVENNLIYVQMINPDQTAMGGGGGGGGGEEEVNTEVETLVSQLNKYGKKKIQMTETCLMSGASILLIWSY